MDTYGVIETDQDSIELSKLIWTICHLQDDYKQDIMAVVETNKQVYIFYQAPYQSNADYLEAFKSHINVSESHNGAVRYNPVLAVIALQEKHSISSNNTNKDHNIEANSKSIEKYLTCMFLSEADNLRYKQIKTNLKKYIVCACTGNFKTSWEP